MPVATKGTTRNSTTKDTKITKVSKSAMRAPVSFGLSRAKAAKDAKEINN